MELDQAKKNGSNKQTKPPYKHKDTKILPEGQPSILQNLYRIYPRKQTIAEKRNEMGMDRRAKHRLQQYQKRINFPTVSRTLQR